MAAGKALAHFAIDAGLSCKEIAAKLGVRRQMISYYKSGRYKPSRTVAVLIQTLTGGTIPVEMWDQAA